MGHKDSRHHHKKKSSHKKKHKKNKKNHKEKKSKHHKKRSSSSSSESDSTESLSSKSDNESDIIGPKPILENAPHAQDESEWNALFSDRNATVKEKRVQKKDRDMLDKPGQSARELNPYWKDGGDGLPPTKEASGRSNDVKYLKKLLEKARDTSDVTGVPVQKIIEEEWGPMDKLKQIIADAESDKSPDEPSKRRVFQRPWSPSEMESSSDRSERRLNFMKPGEGSGSAFMNTYQRNWKKKDLSVDEPVVNKQSEVKETVTGTEEKKPVLTPDELNALTAKAMKAEIKGDKALAEKLRKEIEIAKKNREAEGSGGSKSERTKEEVVVLTKTNSKGMTRPCDNIGQSQGSRKRQKVETHVGNERVRYFMDDDKYSLKSMFEKEKFSTSDQSDEIFLKMAKRGKIRSNDDNDMDDDFLDRVRGSDYERKESEKEMRRTLNEAKTKHKSLNNCRWCLDGNNVQRHLIVSIGAKCYMCLPCDESLTTGHCLIVPIHHDMCGTLLDEDVWNEMQQFRNNLCRMFEEDGQDVVFFENARSFHRFPHMVLHCVPLDKEIGDLAPIYFKKAIMESETEWSNNKKVIDLKNKDLKRSVPKGLPYFAVDFGREGGFAHVIEDEKLFPANFAEEIIGGMLDLDVAKWRKKKRESLENQKEKVQEFIKRWKKFEFSESKKRGRSSSSSSSD